MKAKELIEKTKKLEIELAKVKAKKKAYGFTISVSDTEVTVQCGLNYPDSIYDKVTEAAKKVGIPYENLCVCAEMSGAKENYKNYVNGGQRAWSRY